MTFAHNDSKLWLVADIEVQKEFAEEAFSLFVSHTQSSQQDTGNISFHTLQDRTAAHKFTTVEIWQDEASLKAHQQTEHYQSFRQQLAKMIIGEPEDRMYLLVK